MSLRLCFRTHKRRGSYKGKFIIQILASLEDVNKEDRIEANREALIKWYRKHAEIKNQELVDKYKTKIGVKPNKVRVRNME
ncbi:YgjP-like metallopeptidase domain-containing protein [Natronospora cellulosivora (SeqCode)]